MNRRDLRRAISRSLSEQGFLLAKGSIIPPDSRNKESIRHLHKEAVAFRRTQAASGLKRHEDRLMTWIAPGKTLDPTRINPTLVRVLAGSEEELVFRWARLHWSVPISAGYGRRLRFLVVDDSNRKLIGLIGLADPVCALRPRDEWVGWSRESRNERLRNVMEAFVLGAVPPYSRLLCGKLVALLATSNEVREAFRREYGAGHSLIRTRRADGRLALITTSSALGRSSIYNRLRFKNETVFQPVGYSSGSGEFHFSNGVYRSIREFALKNLQPTAKKESWGTGFRNRREIVRRTLAEIGLSRELLYHGVKREVFAVPLAHNTREFLRGEAERLRWFDRPLSALFGEFRERWLLPRAERDRTYAEFDPESFRLYGMGHE